MALSAMLLVVNPQLLAEVSTCRLDTLELYEPPAAPLHEHWVFALQKGALTQRQVRGQQAGHDC